MDPNVDRFSLTERSVHGTLSTYKQIYDRKNRNKKCQANYCGHILKRMTFPQEKTQAGLLGGISKEGTVVVGDESSRRFFRGTRCGSARQ